MNGERGSFLVVGAIALACFAVLGGGLLEVGQWFQHRRNLQVRTDAAALAGGQKFNECFDTVAFTPAQAAADIETLAAQYSGIPGSVTINGTSVTSTYNRGWQGFTSGDDGIGFQSSTYPTPGGSLPARNYNSPGSSEECDTLELDVKQSQNLPNILSIPTPQWTTHGWARVQIQQVQSVVPTLPLAIPNFDLSQVGVTFVDETTGGNELSGCTGSIVPGGCTYALTKNPPPIPPDTTNFVAQDGEHLARFTLSPTAINLPTPTGASKGDLIGVRVAVGGGVGSCANTPGTTGVNSYACLELNGPPYNGLVGIRDFATAQTAQPALYDVMPSETCSSDTSPFVGDATGATTCPATIQAKIDFGTGAGTNPETSGPQANVTADVGGITVDLHAASWVSGNTWLWQTTGGTLSIPIGALSTQSEFPVTLSWTSKNAVGGKKKGDFGGDVVQRFTSADLSDDGPVRMISLSGSGASGSPYSSTAGSDTVGVTVVVSEAGISNHLSILRASHNGSSTSFILCHSSTGHTSPYSPEGGDPGIQDGIRDGCSFQYTINPTLTCPDPGGAMPLPADCVQNKPSSDEANSVKTALNDRLCGGSGGTVYPNNWPDFTVPGDKRRVTLLLTTYNAYLNGGKSGGSQPYPVSGFGDFYITGFWGDACPIPAPGPPPYPDDPQPAGAAKGDIWGYFIKYSNGGGIPSGRKCNPNQFGECVAALIR